MKGNIIRVQYCDPHSILVVNVRGIIKRVYCPFRVKCISPIDLIKIGSWTIVEEVLSGELDELIYSIQGRHYPHSYFTLQIRF